MKTITLVIPVYNEQERIFKAFAALKSGDLAMPKGFKLGQIIFVNDGSTDATKRLILDFQNQVKKLPIMLIGYSQNKGKGFALRLGLSKSTADYTLLADADISTPFFEIDKFVNAMQKNVDIIIGTRKNGHSMVLKHQSRVREYLGRGFTKITQLVLGVSVSDFTCGFKAFSKKAKSSILANSHINRWAYDPEFILIGKNAKMTMEEIPVLWSNVEKSRVKLYRDIPLSLYELLYIVYLHRLKPFIATKVKTVRSHAYYRFVDITKLLPNSL